MTFDGEGNLLVAAMAAGAVYRYPAAAERRAQPAPSPPEPLLSGLDLPSPTSPSSRPMTGEYLYVGETDQVSRYPYDPAGPLGEPESCSPICRPTVTSRGPSPSARTACSTWASAPPATSATRTTSGGRPSSATTRTAAATSCFAWGLRNAVGLAFQPETDLLWATVNERDDQGNEIPPDLVTIVEAGRELRLARLPAAGRHPAGAGRRLRRRHAADGRHPGPLGAAGTHLRTGDGVPDELAGGLFVAQHGSWNRQPPAAPKLLLITFEDGGRRRPRLRDRLAGRERRSLGSTRRDRRRPRRQPDRLRRRGRPALPHQR